MIKSMTGYGRAQDVIDGRDITVEIKSVNHRFFEFSSRTPRVYGYLDEKIKSFLQGKIARGKVEVSVQIVNPESQGTMVEVNLPLAKSYTDAMHKMAEELDVKDDVSVSILSRFSDIFTVRKEQDDEEAVWQAVQSVLQKALDRFIQMRESEGEKMSADVLSRLVTIEGWVSDVEKLSPLTVTAYRERLYSPSVSGSPPIRDFVSVWKADKASSRWKERKPSLTSPVPVRSEERRVGKECRSRWSP